MGPVADEPTRPGSPRRRLGAYRSTRSASVPTSCVGNNSDQRVDGTPSRAERSRPIHPLACAAAHTGPTAHKPPRFGYRRRGPAPPPQPRAGWFVSSAAQSRKLERKPCGTAGTFRLLSIRGQPRNADRLAASAGKHQWAVPSAEFTRRLENLHRSAGERHPVLALRLHAAGGNRPNSGRQIDLVPPCAAYLS